MSNPERSSSPAATTTASELERADRQVQEALQLAAQAAALLSKLDAGAVKEAEHHALRFAELMRDTHKTVTKAIVELNGKRDGPEER